MIIMWAEMLISMNREPLSGAGHVDKASVIEPIYRRDLERGR